MKKLAITIIMCLFCVAFAGQASAHRLNVFAWLENDQILVDCAFPQNRPAKNAHVAILDNVTKKTLLEGKTNQEGRFSFPTPDVIRQGHGLLIEVNAGQGHRGEWLMDASELYAAASLAAGFDNAAIAASQEGKDSHVHVEARRNAPFPQPAVTHDQAREIAQAVVEQRLAPLRRQLAASAVKGPGITEIIGGLGWIVGLVGIGLYFKSRKSGDA